MERDAAVVGWLDGDARPDRVVMAHNGEGTTVEWGTAGGGFGRPVGIRALVGGRHGETAAGVVSDFNRDDELDLAVVVSKLPVGDDPVPARIGEIRLGPLHRNGRSGQTLGLGIDENSGLSLTDFNHDGLPDVAAWEYAGDGVYGVTPLLGTGSGLSRKGGERWSTREAAPVSPHLPGAPLTGFYHPCKPGG